MKKTLAWLLITVMTVALFATFPVSADPAPITIHSFDAITDMAGNYILGSDIQNAGAPMIGTVDAPFTGTFNGDGHTVSGLTGSIFNQTKGATIKNLIVAGSTVNYKDLKGHTGLVCNVAVEGVFDEIHLGPGVNIKITETLENDLYIGGIVGYISGAKFQISYCSFEGSLYYENMNKARMAGIVGMAYGQSIADCVISRCWNTGSIENFNLFEKKDTKVAGICSNGEFFHITECWNTGSIKTNEKNGQTAGIFGCPDDFGGQDYKISYCYNTGAITGGNYAAGIMGYSNRSGGVLSHCVNYGMASAGNRSKGVIGLTKNTEQISNIVSLTGCGDALYDDNGKAAYDAATCIQAADMEQLIATALTYDGMFERKGDGIILKWQASYTMPNTGDPAPVEPPVTTTEPVVTTTEPVVTTTEPIVTTTEPIVTTTPEPDANTTTKTPDNTTKAPGTTEAPEQGGCGSLSLSFVSLAVVMLAGITVAIKKIKH